MPFKYFSKIKRKFLGKNFGRNFTTGFTLVETLVGAFVFVIVLSIVAGVFTQQMRLNRVAMSMMSMNDAMGLTMEQISREVRTGTEFCTSKDILTTRAAQCNDLKNDDPNRKQDAVLQFINSKGKIVRYRINKTANSSAIEKAYELGGSVCTDGSLSNDGQFCYQPITSDNVYLNSFKIDLAHNNQIANEYAPPRITLNMSLTSNEPEVKRYGISTNIQLTISGRNF